MGFYYSTRQHACTCVLLLNFIWFDVMTGSWFADALRKPVTAKTPSKCQDNRIAFFILAALKNHKNHYSWHQLQANWKQSTGPRQKLNYLKGRSSYVFLQCSPSKQNPLSYHKIISSCLQNKTKQNKTKHHQHQHKFPNKYYNNTETQNISIWNSESLTFP